MGILALLLPARFALLYTLDTQLSGVAHGLLERRPVLRLVRRQFEAGFERRDTRIGKSSHIGSTRTVTLLRTGTAKTVVAEALLRIHQ